MTRTNGLRTISSVLFAVVLLTLPTLFAGWAGDGSPRDASEPRALDAGASTTLDLAEVAPAEDAAHGARDPDGGGEPRGSGALLDLLTGKPGLAEALVTGGIADVASLLDPESATARLGDVRVTDVLRILAEDVDGVPAGSRDEAPSLEDALSRWANVSGRADAEDEILRAVEESALLPGGLAESLARLVDALVDAETLRKEAFEGVAEEDLLWLLEFDREGATEAELERVEEISRSVDVKALARGALRLVSEAERQTPVLRELAGLEIATPAAAPLATRAPPPPPDARFRETIATIRLTSGLPGECAAVAESFAATREGAHPLRDAITTLTTAAGGDAADPEAARALAAADRLPIDLQLAVARVVDAYAFALRESLRAAFDAPPECSESGVGSVVGALAVLHAMNASAPALSKWSLVLEHAPAVDEVGDVDAFVRAQEAGARTQDGSVGAATAYAAWQAKAPLLPPRSIDVPTERPLERAVLDVYDALGIEPEPEERRRLAEEAASVAPWLQVEAARILLAEARTIRAMRAPIGEAADALRSLERDAPEAERRILSTKTTWEDVLWLRAFYANAEAARRVQHERHQAVFELGLAMDEATANLRALPLEALDGATRPESLSAQAWGTREPRHGVLDALRSWWRSIVPVGSASAQAPSVPYDSGDAPPPVTTPREVEGLVPTGTNDVLFEDPLQLVVLGGLRSTVYRETLNLDNPGRQVLVLDLGGDDVYLNAAGGATTEGRRPVPVAVAIDLSGNDRHDARVPHTAQGGALAAHLAPETSAPQPARATFTGAVGILLDYQGDDRYVGPALSQGAAASDSSQGFALGVLADGRGNDTYTAAPTEPLLRRRDGQMDADLSGWQGFAAHWTPAWLDASAAADPARAATLTTPSFLSSVTGILVDAHGDDRLFAERGQGLAVVEDGRYTPGAFTRSVQGNDPLGLPVDYGAVTTYGWKPHALGAVVNRGGNDTNAGCLERCQGAGAGGLGILADFGGDDTYSAVAAAPVETAPAERGDDRHWVDGRFGVGIDASTRDGDDDGFPAYLEFLVDGSDGDDADPRPSAWQDRDGDHYPDVVEERLRTDPRDPNSRPASAPASPPVPLPVPSGSDKIIDIGLDSRVAARLAGLDVDVDAAAVLQGGLPRLFALGAQGPTTYAADYALVLDLGGDDVYRNNAGGNLPYVLQPLEPTRDPFFRFAIDGIDANVRAVQENGVATNNDLTPSSQISSLEQSVDGRRVGGIPGVVLDVDGNDDYRSVSNRPNQGSADGAGALGVLVDLLGSDNYVSLGEGPHQGAAVVSDAVVGTASMAGAFGLLFDVSGGDRYRSPVGMSQGFARGPLAFGHLVDASARTNAGSEDNVFEARRQGFALAEGLNVNTVGLFASVGGGSDSYVGTDASVATLVQGTVESVGVGSTPGVGVFLDVGGKDRYVSGERRDESAARNDVTRLPSYPPETRRVAVFVDVEDSFRDDDTDGWPDLLEALVGTNASKAGDRPVACDPAKGVSGNDACSVEQLREDAAGFLLKLPTLGVAVGNVENTTYTHDYHLVVDLGGSNAFLNNAGGAHASTALLLALAGDEDESVFVEPPGRRVVEHFGRGGVQGGARLGVGVAIVDGGSARFEATNLSQGAAEIGAGVLLLRNTREASFRGLAEVQGAAPNLGIGILWSDGVESRDSYEARELAQAASGFRALATIDPRAAVAILYDGGGRDRFDVTEGRGQAYATASGLAVLASAGVDADDYRLGGPLGQGAALGVRPVSSGSVNPANTFPVAALVDEGGDDTFVTEIADAGARARAQGYGELGVGLLLNFGGNDAYEARGAHVETFAQGVGWGDPRPSVASGTQSISSPSQRGIGVLSDEAGDDRYVAEGDVAQGAGAGSGLGLFLEWSGDDGYAAGKRSQGFGFVSGAAGEAPPPPSAVPPLPPPPPSDPIGAFSYVGNLVFEWAFKELLNRWGVDWLGWTSDGLVPTASGTAGTATDRGFGAFLDLGGWDAYATWDGERAMPLLGDGPRRSASGALADAGAGCHGSRPILLNARGNDAAWFQESGVGIDAQGTSAAACAFLMAVKALYEEDDSPEEVQDARREARGALPYHLEPTACEDGAEAADWSGEVDLLEGDACIAVKARDPWDASSRELVLERAVLYWEADARHEDVSHELVLVAEGNLTDGDASGTVATFRVNSTRLEDGHAWLVARLHHRAPWSDTRETSALAGSRPPPKAEAGTVDVLHPVVVDNPPRASVTGPSSVNPDREDPTFLLRVSRDVPGRLGDCGVDESECHAARGSHETPLVARPADEPLPAPLRIPPFLEALTRPHPDVVPPTLTVGDADGGVEVAWEEDPSAEAYVVYRGVGAANPLTLDGLSDHFLGWTHAPTTRVVDRDVVTGETYWYFVAAVVGHTPPSGAADGELHESEYHDDFARSITVDLTKPGRPSALRAEAGEGWVTLTWPRTPLVEEYRLARRPTDVEACRDPAVEDDACPQVTVKSDAACGATLCRHVDGRGLLNNSSYAYRVGSLREQTGLQTTYAWTPEEIVTVNPGAFVTITVAPEGGGAPLVAEIRYVAAGADVPWAWDATGLPDGRYAVEVSAAEAGTARGGPLSRDAVTVVLDRTPPTSSVPLAAFVNASARVDTPDGPGVILSWRVDDSGSGPRDVSVARVATGPSGNSTLIPWRYRASVDAEAPWRLAHGESVTLVTVARDAAGNLENATTKPPQTVTADFVPPVLDHVDLPSNGKPGGRVPVVAEVKDGVSGVREVRAWLAGAGAPPTTLARKAGDAPIYEGTLLLDVPASTAGEYAVVIEAEDLAGNVGRQTRFLLVDAKAPLLVEATFAYEFGGVHGAGRPGTTARLVVLAVDDDAVARVFANATNVSLTPDASFSRNALTGAFEADVRLDRPNLTDGEHNVSLRIVDASGNAAEEVVAVAIDNRAVDVLDARVVSVGSTWVRLAWNTTGDATSSARSGLDPATLREAAEELVFRTSHDFNLTGLSPGRTYHVQPVSHTRSGIAASAPVLVVETLPPIPVSFTSPAEGAAWSGTATVEWSTPTADEPIHYVVSLRDGSRRWSVADASSADTSVAVSFDTRLVPDGVYRVEVEASRGHETTLALTGDVLVDNTPPVLRVIRPSTGSAVRGPDVIVEAVATDALSGNLTATLSTGSRTLEATVRGASVRALAHGLPEGPLELVLVVRDAAGNEAVERVPVTVIATPPRLLDALVLHPGGLEACAPPCELTLRARPTDPRRLAAITVEPSADVEPVAPFAPREGGWLESSFRVLDGAHGERVPVMVRLEDAVGNVAHVEAARVRVDRETPSLHALTAAPMGPSSIAVDVRADEPVTLVVEVEKGLDGRPIVLTRNERALKHFFPVAGLRPGVDHVVRVTLRDAAGNEVASETRATTSRDLEAPGQVSALRASLTGEGSVVLEWDAAADDVGVALYRVYRKAVDDVDWHLVAEVSGRRHVDVSPVADRLNLYDVRAVDWGANEGPMSAAVDVHPLTPLTLADGAVTPETGPSHRPFTFTVLVTSPREADAVLVHVVVNGVPYAMTRTADDACRARCAYEADVRVGAPRLGDPDATFSFVATDGSATVRNPAEGESYRGPLVVASGISGATLGVPLTQAALVAVTAACVAALVMPIGRRWRK